MGQVNVNRCRMSRITLSVALCASLVRSREMTVTFSARRSLGQVGYRSQQCSRDKNTSLLISKNAVSRIQVSGYLPTMRQEMAYDNFEAA